MNVKEFDALLQEYDDAQESRSLIWSDEYDRREGISAVRKTRDKRADDLRSRVIEAFKEHTKETSES